MRFVRSDHWEKSGLLTVYVWTFLEVSHLRLWKCISRVSLPIITLNIRRTFISPHERETNLLFRDRCPRGHNRSSLVYWLGYGPLKAESGVQFPDEERCFSYFICCLKSSQVWKRRFPHRGIEPRSRPWEGHILTNRLMRNWWRLARLYAYISQILFPFPNFPL